ncbi:hypothetical protein CBW24_02085 [Pacificitalea manganoxidans]|uniref:Permease n=1 Tax=Pacificitalea manganoxidans TaxID=1411902 RepID=A0A291LVZ1_9RHOB|nr:AEC family transporter [Pacificitalea manganoxidans]ATI40906.1 hypothetical protein CBW24_02085 [Pacificitalea manganoxidans]MDR6308250.1 hypothetical protein [Pacificitalea manganoxidans]
MLSTIIPLFAIIALGYVAIRSGYVEADRIPVIGGFVVKIALPALIVNAVATRPLAETIYWPLVLGYAAASLLLMLTGTVAARLIFGTSVGQSAVIGLGMSGSNSGFMGYPIALSAMGPIAGTVLANCVIVENTVLIPVALLLIGITESRASGGTGAQALRKVALATARNPLILALVASLIVSGFALPLPAEALRAVEMLSNIAAPLALFVIGGTLASLPFKGVLGKIVLVTAGKLILHPLVVFAAMLAIGVRGDLLVTITIFAAVPMMSIYPLFGQRVDLAMMSASALMMSTILSFATLAVALWLLMPLVG